VSNIVPIHAYEYGYTNHKTLGAAALPDPRSQSPLSVRRILATLQRLAAAPEGLTLTEIAEALSAPKTSVVGLLKGLIEESYVTRDGHLYRLGPESHLLAGRILAGRNLGQLARPTLEALAAQTGETSGLAVLSNDRTEMIYTEFVSGSNPIRFEATRGERHPLHSGPGGRLMLSLQSDDYIARYLASVDLVAVTGNAVTDKARLLDLLAQARRELFTATFSESVAGAAAFSAPVFNESGLPLAAVLLIGPIERLRENQAPFAGLVRRAGAEISRLLGSARGVPQDAPAA
jgi:DNA-binding IclR family transcriptional regulator